DGQLTVVLGAATDTDPGRSSAAIAALPTGRTGGAVVVYDAAAAASVLSEAAHRAAQLRPSQARAARPAVYAEARRLLVQVRDNSVRWVDFAEWVAFGKSRGGGWDQDLVEDVVRM